MYSSSVRTVLDISGPDGALCIGIMAVAVLQAVAVREGGGAAAALLGLLFVASSRAAGAAPEPAAEPKPKAP